tara:strand:- start:1970 stop:2149 length:180 start_codon:yes stop_codon:yes gene_type:complete
VLNPRDVSEDVMVIHFQEKSKAGVILQDIALHAGELFIPPESTEAIMISYLERGLIERA